ncbi:MAG: SDR family NAD(P)-dependent oxidoreductase [Deltaproteobacteria bacterium]|nr:SDR family NAD(P)-dependent oxidoreductase [Deltaproteobacteria bacterium]MBN2671634.1 SDR family NAD(P)-dependent oxidoreductase [Deltaproteobacteria bacterium]
MAAKNKGIAGATIEGVKGGFKKGAVYNESQFNVHGKSCLITGANSGLGKGIAIRMATLGAHVTMAGRTLDETARHAIAEASGNSNVAMEKLDLASFQNVRAFCRRIKEADQHFDIVILNAATVAKEGRLTKDGLDTMTQVNFLSNVLLIETLLKNESIRNARTSKSPLPPFQGGESAKSPLPPFQGGESTEFPPGEIPRIVVVSSEAHRWSESIDIDAIDKPRTFKMKESMKVYSDTKFMMAAYTSNLAKRLTEQAGPVISVHAHCPGAVNSNLAREAPPFLQPLLKGIFFLFFASPQKASRPAVHLACSPTLTGKTGLYYHLMNEKQFDERALDADFQQQLLQKALQITGA